LKLSWRAFSIHDAKAGNQMASRQPRTLVTSPDQIQHLIPITLPASRIEPFMVAIALNDPGHLSQVNFRAIIAASEDNLKLDPYWPRLAKTKRCAETCG
jgi:hypothetical protein